MSSFFERYFEALDGTDPQSSLAMVSDEVEFSILWSENGKCKEFIGGKADLRRFGEAGAERRKWRHHTIWGASDGDGEWASGETRYDDGTKVGTYMVFAQLDEQGRMVRYMAVRTPVASFMALPRRF